MIVGFPPSPSLIPYFVLFLIKVNSAFASTPNVIFSVEDVDGSWLAKRAVFGSEADLVTGVLVHSPEEDTFLCDYFNEDQDEGLIPSTPDNDIIMVVPRGGCSYEKKAFAARELYGSVAVLVYDNLSARYSWNETTKRVIFPRDQYEYECANGFGTAYNLNLDPPTYNATIHDPILDMKAPTNSCSLQQTHSPCESQLCVVTAHTRNSAEFPVCCAWDLPRTMGKDSHFSGDTSDIVSVFITIRQSEDILLHLGSVGRIESRPYSAFNSSIVFMWILAVGLTAYACWLPAGEYREFRSKLAEFKARRDEQKNGPKTEQFITLEDLDDQEEDDDGDGEDVDTIDLEHQANNNKSDRLSPSQSPRKQRKGSRNVENNEREGEVWVLRSLPPPERKKRRKRAKKKANHNSVETPALSEAAHIPGASTASNSIELNPHDSLPPPERKRGRARKKTNHDSEETTEMSEVEHIPGASTTSLSIELNPWHVLSFIGVASAILFILFYKRWFGIVALLYGFGCAGTVSYLIFGPTLVYIIPKLGDEWTREMNKPVVCGLNGFDVTSQLLGFVWAILWLWYGLSHYKPLTNAFFWLSMDVFGASVCIMMVGVLRLNNVRLATLFMAAIFVYDVFFVFITPLFLNGESVMLSVAQGSATDATSDDFCYKYPNDRQCTGITFLPMLLVLPRINDYTNGQVLLGLGDIVRKFLGALETFDILRTRSKAFHLVPGFLIAFSARVDEAARLVGKHTTVEMQIPEKWYQGYFFPMMIAYAVGLALAYIVFVAMKSGQPALLYIVPCCLGTMFFIGRKELKDLWKGARQIRLADKLKRRYERAWGKERMKRYVAKKKRERALAGDNVGAWSRLDPTGTIHSEMGPPDESNLQPSTSGPSPKETNIGTNRRGRGGRAGRGFDQAPGRAGGRGNTFVGGNPNNRSRGRSPERVSDSPASRINASEPTETSLAQQSLTTNKSEKIDLQPSNTDVYFGNEKHSGTKAFRRAVAKSRKMFSEDEFTPDVYRAIKKQLKGRRFFNSNGKEATKAEFRAAMKKAFEELPSR